MDSPVEVFARAVSGFRDAHGRDYLQQLKGEPTPGPRRDRPPLGDQLLEQAISARTDGSLSADEHASLCAQLARATLERQLRGARALRLGLSQSLVIVGSAQRPLGDLLMEWLAARAPSARRELGRLLEPAWEAYVERAFPLQAEAEGAAGAMLKKLGGGRHPDAGPEDGSRGLAERWLRDTRDLADTAFSVARKLHGADDAGEETLWSALGPRYRELYPREDRFRRVGGELRALGLLEPLRRATRVSYAHPDVLFGTQVVPVAVPSQLYLCPSSFPIGLAAEWRAAEAVGRAAALSLASPALFPGLRHPVAGTVARALGHTLALRFLDPAYLRRERGLSRREADDTARCLVAHALVESRLAAAGVLSRGQSRGIGHTLVEDALRGPTAPQLSALLLVRNSASATLRGKVYGAGLFAALRERFDGDWHKNPRALDPVCGAAVRAGALSAEALGEELGVSIEAGIALYSELF